MSLLIYDLNGCYNIALNIRLKLKWKIYLKMKSVKGKNMDSGSVPGMTGREMGAPVSSTGQALRGNDR